MDWLCVHCGTPVPDHGDKCPNCDENPFRLEPGELLNVSPKDFRKFISNGKLETKKRNRIQNKQ